MELYAMHIAVGYQFVDFPGLLALSLGIINNFDADL
jgi:hypothetical protein